MNELQRRFFTCLAEIQEKCVAKCMIEYGVSDEKLKKMLYDVTYENTTAIMELIDGYSSFGSDRHDIVNTVTKKGLKEEPFIELHDKTEDYLKY